MQRKHSSSISLLNKFMCRDIHFLHDRKILYNAIQQHNVAIANFILKTKLQNMYNVNENDHKWIVHLSEYRFIADFSRTYRY